MTDSEWKRGFSKKLTTIMNEKGISVKELSESSGVSESDISKYLNQVSIPRYEGALESIADAINCTVTELTDFVD